MYPPHRSRSIQAASGSSGLAGTSPNIVKTAEFMIIIWIKQIKNGHFFKNSNHKQLKKI